jgi:hypothetical protein
MTTATGLAKRIDSESTDSLDGQVKTLSNGGFRIRPTEVRKTSLGYEFNIQTHVHGYQLVDQVISAYQQEMVRVSGYTTGQSRTSVGKLLSFVWGTEHISEFHANVRKVIEHTQEQVGEVTTDQLLSYAVGNMLAYRHGKLFLN